VLTPSSASLAGQAIGAYTFESLLGQGGMVASGLRAAATDVSKGKWR